MVEVVIYHNPRCSKSRAALDLLRGRGIEPQVVLYLENPPSASELKAVLAKLGLKPRDVIRAKEAREEGVDPSALADDALIAAMVAHPRIIERPIAVAGAKAALGRPPERVLDII